MPPRTQVVCLCPLCKADSYIDEHGQRCLGKLVHRNTRAAHYKRAEKCSTAASSETIDVIKSNVPHEEVCVHLPFICYTILCLL
jgi:hypothetical protein